MKKSSPKRVIYINTAPTW